MIEIFYTDGSHNPLTINPSFKSSICIIDEKRERVTFEFIGNHSHFIAEAQAILRCLEINPGRIHIKADCKSIVDLLNDGRLPKHPKLNDVLTQIRALNRDFIIEWVPREKNLAGHIISRLRKILLPGLLSRVPVPLFS